MFYFCHLNLGSREQYDSIKASNLACFGSCLCFTWENVLLFFLLFVPEKQISIFPGEGDLNIHFFFVLSLVCECCANGMASFNINYFGNFSHWLILKRVSMRKMWCAFKKYWRRGYFYKALESQLAEFLLPWREW